MVELQRQTAWHCVVEQSGVAVVNGRHGRHRGIGHRYYYAFALLNDFSLNDLDWQWQTDWCGGCERPVRCGGGMRAWLGAEQGGGTSEAVRGRQGARRGSGQRHTGVDVVVGVSSWQRLWPSSGEANSTVRPTNPAHLAGGASGACKWAGACTQMFQSR